MRSTPRVVYLVFVALAVLALGEGISEAGVAIAIAKAKTGANSDVKYWLRHDATSTGPKMEKLVRKAFKDAYRTHESDWKRYPYSTHSSDVRSGYYIVIKYKGTDSSDKPYTRYALGYGATEAAALEEAKKELARRDWSWKRRMGYSVVEKGSL